MTRLALLALFACASVAHAADYADTFNRANGDLDGSTSSDTQFTWDEPSGDGFAISGNAVVGPGNENGTFHVAVALTGATSDNMYVKLDITTFAGTNANVGVFLGSNSDFSNGYGFETGTGGAWRIYLADDTTIDSGTQSNLGTTSYTLCMQRASNVIKVYRDGVQVTGAEVTDTSQSTGSGNRLAGFTWFDATGGSTNALTVDNFAYGDGGCLPAPATLSDATPSGTLETTDAATIGATTDQNSGTFYAVVDTDLSGITASQVKAGTDASNGSVVADCSASVSTTSPSCGVTGLSPNTAYSFAVVQNNTNGDSNVLTGSFTTADIPATGHEFVQEAWGNVSSGADTVDTAEWESPLTSGNLLTCHMYVDLESDLDLDGLYILPDGAVDEGWLKVSGQNKYFASFYIPAIAGGSTTATSVGMDLTLQEELIFAMLSCSEWFGFDASPRLEFKHQLQASPGLSTDGLSSGSLGTISIVPAGIVAISINQNDTVAPDAGTDFDTAVESTLFGTARIEHRRITMEDTYAATFTALQDVLHYTAAWAFTESGQSAPSYPIISSVTPATFADGEAGIVVAGGNFSDEGNALLICPTDDVEDMDCEAQTITSESSTSITFTAVLGSNTPGQTAYLYVVNADMLSNLAGYEVEFEDEEPVDIVATKLIFGAQPGNVIVGQTFGAFTVRAVDDANDLDDDYTEEVTLSLCMGDGSLGGTTTQEAAAGVATFDDIFISTLNMDAALCANDGALTGAESDPFDVIAGGGGNVGIPASSRIGGVLQ